MNEITKQDSCINTDSSHHSNANNKFTIQTSSGLSAKVTQTFKSMDNALDEIYQCIDTKKGAVFSSGFDYPGRHSRWDLGFVDPALEFVSHGRKFAFNALNEQGNALLTLIGPALTSCNHIAELNHTPTSISGQVLASQKHIKEEDRSRQPSIFSVLRQLTSWFHSADPQFSHFGLYGAFGYDLIHQFEQIDLKLSRKEHSKDCHLFIPLSLTVIDRKREIAFELSCSFNTPSGATSNLEGGGKTFPLAAPTGNNEIKSDHAAGEFAKKVSKVVDGTTRGDYFEVVLSQTFSTIVNDTPTELFQRLAKINPSPYMFLINFGDEQLIGASPEIYVRVRGRTYETCPIAGTAIRGTTALEDAEQVQQLINSHKDESELTMCTDVDRNDMARVCKAGSVRIIGRRQLEFYSHLIHTVDHLQGTLADQYDAIDAFQSHMWACTVTGAPKPAAVQEIENLETSPRGWYSGAIGCLTFNGDINTGITLRTATIKNGHAYIRAGATLLFGSQPDLEEQETRTKAAAFLAALANVKTPDSEKCSDARDIQTRQYRSQLSARKVLLIDFQDSFVHNLAAYLREIGVEVSTLRSGFPLEMLSDISPHMVLLSPGPCTPSDFNMSKLIDELIKQSLPIFGVCLGHQGIGEYFGASLAQLPTPAHGKSCSVTHSGDCLFKDIKNPFEVGRYHSLYLPEENIPAELKIIAHSVPDARLNDPFPVVMGIRHTTLPIAGVQFHPESLMTLKSGVGHCLLRNVIKELT